MTTIQGAALCLIGATAPALIVTISAESEDYWRIMFEGEATRFFVCACAGCYMIFSGLLLWVGRVKPDSEGEGIARGVLIGFWLLVLFTLAAVFVQFCLGWDAKILAGQSPKPD